MKTDHLTSYCKGYIALIALFTLNALVKTHQEYDRRLRAAPEPPLGVVWPEIDRRMADLDLSSCLKFLINYSFFKMGIEICFVTMVGCIGFRLDVFALTTALWLCCMFLLRRKSLARLWPLYILYLCLSVPLQYLIAIGLPPGLCIGKKFRVSCMRKYNVHRMRILSNHPFSQSIHGTAKPRKQKKPSNGCSYRTTEIGLHIEKFSVRIQFFVTEVCRLLPLCVLRLYWSHRIIISRCSRLCATCPIVQSAHSIQHRSRRGCGLPCWKQQRDLRSQGRLYWSKTESRSGIH